MLHCAVWTGTEMVVWGGHNAGGYQNDGGRYDPATDTWTPVTTTGALSNRGDAFAAWTGTEMLVSGGEDAGGRLNDGRRYNPQTNAWGSSLATMNAPAGRAGGAFAWTGSEMFVWGGISNSEFVMNTGGRYDAASNTWQATTLTNALSARRSDQAVWVGSIPRG